METLVMKRLLTEREAMDYLGVKRTKLREYAEEIKCIKHIGKRVLYDKTIIDKALDEL